jgi:hypothetical protein
MNVTQTNTETLVYDQKVTYLVRATQDEIESLYEELREADEDEYDSVSYLSDAPMYRVVLFHYFTRGCKCPHCPCGHWQSRVTSVKRGRIGTYEVQVLHYRNT